ncbi:MAG: Hsp20 family protein [Alphaproteobacteria bacterium]|nr:Hsp20 family protein [Alphaproteobacteria bacterium]
MTLFESPFLLGFEQFERTLNRIAKSAGDGYPPYNIERVGDDGIRITVAVAGFTKDDLDVALEENQLVIRGKHRGEQDEKDRVFLHRGIAARQFQRAFVLADGIEVVGATLDSGLLGIDLRRPSPEQVSRKIEIKASAKSETAINASRSKAAS